MQSVIQKKYSGSVKIFWLDRERLFKNIEKSAGTLASERDEVRKIVLFGSVAEGRALPSSDVDIMIIVRRSDAGFIDRPLIYNRYFDNVGLAVELFVYTEDEVTCNDIGLVKTATARGVVLYARTD